MISVIIPCYNQGQYLNQAIESVIQQTYNSWECIIVNDGSPDNTEEIALKLCSKDHRIKYLVKLNGGLSSARNYGISNSSGEYVIVLDADDKLAPSYIEKCLKEFLSSPKTKIVYSEAYKFDGVQEKWNLEEYSFNRLLITNMIYCSAMFKRCDWQKAGGYNESLKRGSEDWEFWLRMLDENSIVKRIPEILFFYRVKPTSMFTQMKEADFDEAYWTAFEQHLSLYKLHYSSPQFAYLKNSQLQNEIQLLRDEIARINCSKWNRIGNRINNLAQMIRLK